MAAYTCVHRESEQTVCVQDALSTLSSVKEELGEQIHYVGCQSSTIIFPEHVNDTLKACQSHVTTQLDTQHQLSQVHRYRGTLSGWYAAL